MQQDYRVLFTRFPHEFWDLIDFTAEGLVLLRIMKNIGFTDDGVCYETRESMCRACHLSKPTWSKAIDSLEAKNIIVIQKEHNKPYQITLHESVARLKIGTQYRKNISSGSNFSLATKRGKYANHSEKHTDREPFQVVKRRIETFQDARNAVSSDRTDAEADDE